MWLVPDGKTFYPLGVKKSGVHRQVDATTDETIGFFAFGGGFGGQWVAFSNEGGW